MSDTAFGYHAVESLIRKEPRRVAALHVQADRQDSRMQALCELSRNQGVSVLSCSKSELDALVAGRHQGVVAVLDPAVGAESAGMMSGLGSVAGAALGLLSDEETKHTIDTIDDALETLRNLRPVTFYYKEEYSSSPERMHHGFIAQEFQKVVPDATYYDESVGKLCIDTTDLIGLLVRANQQLETRLTRLEAKQALVAV